MLFGFLTLSSVSHAALIYESSSEFFGSGDFNADGITDVLVLDKSTGNARVGYQNLAGALTWSQPLPTGAESADALAVGRFSNTNLDQIAVTSVEMNRIHVLSLSNSISATTPLVVNPPHPATALLVGLEAPYGVIASRTWLTAGSHDPGLTVVDLLEFVADDLAVFQDQIATEGHLNSASSFRRTVSDATLLAGIRRGTNDTFLAYAYTNTSAPALTRSNLASGTEYVFGHFNNEPYPRMLFYVPGQSNVVVQPLIFNGSDFEFGAATVNTFTSAVQQVFYVDEQTNGLIVIRFGDGVVGLRPPTGSGGQLQVDPGVGLGASGNVVGLVPLGFGKFALLSSASNSLSSVTAQVFALSDGNYTEISSSTLPSVTTAATRGNVWLFQTEPFLSSAATLLGSLSAPVWSSTIIGMPASLSVRVESDGGITSGLGSPATNNFGTPPTGTAYVLPNQYRNDISFFSYTPPRPPEQFALTISPPPGSYGGPIQISFIKTNTVEVSYRTSATGTWLTYATPFTLTNDATIEFYGRISNDPRGRIQYASYTLGRTNFSPEAPVTLPDGGGGNTNPPPTNLPGTIVSANGTIFYSRSDATIWTINLDGSGDQLVTSGGYNPRVSPDGNYMLFFQGGIGTMLRNMQTGVETQIHPSYHSVVGYDWETNSQNFVIDYECLIWGGDLAGNYTPLPLGDCNDDAPVVNHSDGSLAYHNSSGNAAVRGIYVMPPSRTTRTKLNLNVMTPGWPSWSPDGQSLAVRAAKTNAPSESADNLWLFNADGTNLRQITALGANDGFPFGAIWSPNGKALIAAGSVWGTNGLWVLRLSADGQYCGCAPIRLPTTPGASIDFAGTVIVPPDFIPDLQPELFIRQESDVVILYWSTNYSGYTLQFTADLPADEWTPIQGAYYLVGDQYEYREPNANLQAERFFRLKAPGVLILTPEP